MKKSLVVGAGLGVLVVLLADTGVLRPFTIPVTDVLLQIGKPKRR